MTDLTRPAAELAGELPDEAAEPDLEPVKAEGEAAPAAEPEIDLAQLRDDLNSLAEAVYGLREQVEGHLAYLRYLLGDRIAADRRLVEQHRATRARHSQPVRDPAYGGYERDTVFGQPRPAVTVPERTEHPVGFRAADPRLSGAR